GDVLQVTFTYEPGKNWVNGIRYRSMRERSIIEGSRYLYDSVGNRMQEVQQRHGKGFGDRYFYDSANRLVGVQYGVEHLDNPSSRFEREVQYDLSSVGTWKRKTTRDIDGQTIDSVDGITNQRDAYQSLGDRNFKYDSNGNRIVEGEISSRFDINKRYTYDY